MSVTRNDSELLPRFNKEEVRLYTLRYLRKLSLMKISEQLDVPLKETRRRLKRVDKKLERLWTTEYIQDLLDQYVRVAHNLTTDCRNVQRGVQMIFNMDYHELHLLFNPEFSKPEDYIGLDMYMFNQKLSEDRYCLLPPSAWELLDHMHMVAKRLKGYADVRKLMAFSPVRKFYDTIAKPSVDPSRMERRLNRYYWEMGGLAEFLLLADKNVFQEHIRRNVVQLEKLIKDNVIDPLEEVIAGNKWEMDRGTYDYVLSYLKRNRAYRKLSSNVVDALTTAITQGLCESFYPKMKQGYTLVTSSWVPLRATRNLTFRQIAITRDPLSVASRIWLKNELKTWSRVCETAEKLMTCTSYVADNLAFVRRSSLLTSPRYLQEKFQREKSLSKAYLLLLNYHNFYNEYYLTFIKQLLHETQYIPVEYTKVRKLRTVMAKKEELANNLDSAAELLYDKVKETYRFLGKFIDEHYVEDGLITPEMRKLLHKIS